MSKGMGMNVDIDRPAVLLDEGVDLAPFDAKNMPIMREEL
jgi:hypothetical protein